jgi:hypothetical protein
VHRECSAISNMRTAPTRRLGVSPVPARSADTVDPGPLSPQRYSSKARRRLRFLAGAPKYRRRQRQRRGVDWTEAVSCQRCQPVALLPLTNELAHRSPPSPSDATYGADPYLLRTDSMESTDLFSHPEQPEFISNGESSPEPVEAPAFSDQPHRETYIPKPTS